ncbi:MAG: sugar phosphate isomerase/epimerase [Verrucomicrobia bacterium]|nr:sugar phosphate isomerase/epimerase [Verrucomicrobiota bacterium]
MSQINRRQAIIRTASAATAGVLGAAGAALSTSAHAQEPPRSKTGHVTVGLATFGFPTLSNAELAKELSAAGVRTIQLFLSQTDSNFWRYNSRSDLSTLTPQHCQAIAEGYRQAGIAIHSLGVCTNLIHPDPAERQANLDYFAAMMKVGQAMGVSVFITEAGDYHSPEPAAGIAYHFREEVWRRMIATGKELATVAERHDAVVLMEPFFGGFLASAKRTRLFLEEVGSPRIRALLDPANLLEVNDLEEMCAQLGPHIDCFHAKDRKLHVERGVPAGQGDLDYRKFVTLAAERVPHAPLILEYVGPADYRQALGHLRDTLRAVGLREA